LSCHAAAGSRVQGGGIYFGSGILVENLCRAILCATLFAALIFCTTNFLQETGGASEWQAKETSKQQEAR